jgi:PAS domain-containing protein
MFVTAFVDEYPLATATAYASGAVDFIFTQVHPDVLRIKVSTYVVLFVQSRELQILNAALRDSEARAQAVLQNVADAIVTADERGLIESFNRSACRLFGYSEDEVIGRPLGLILAPGDHDELPDPTRAAAPSLTRRTNCEVDDERSIDRGQHLPTDFQSASDGQSGPIAIPSGELWHARVGFCPGT